MDSMARRFVVLVVALALASLVFAGSAAASSSVTYGSLQSVVVPNNSGPNGIPTTIEVDPGRPPVQSLEVRDLQPVWPTHGTDFSAWLDDPVGDRIVLMTEGCESMPGGTHFSLEDSAPFFADGSGTHGDEFCSTQLENGVGKPHNDDGKTLNGTFAGTPSSGPWRLYVRDSGDLSGGGTFNGWALRITHVPLKLKASVKRKKKATKSVQATLECNADCRVVTGGAAKTSVVSLLQGQPRKVSIGLTSSGRKRLEDKGKVKVTLAADTVYGDSHQQALKVKAKS